MPRQWKQLAGCAAFAAVLGAIGGHFLHAEEPSRTASTTAGASSADSDDEQVDRHLMTGYWHSLFGPRHGNCEPCPTQAPCQTPSAPTQSPYDMPTPAVPPMLTQPSTAPLLASAAEGNLGGGPTSGTVPTMIGDIFSGVPTQNITTGGPAGSMSNTPFPTSPTTGYLKLADGTSPIPRDRIIFNYSYFQNVPFTTNGINVNRFVAGFEKTLFSDWFSVEMIVPFATTLNQDVTVNGQNLVNATAVELGDVTVWAKALLARTDTWAVSAGMGVCVPTASDLSVTVLPSTPDLYRIKNQTTYLLPFVGGVWTPTDRFFVQQFLQLDVPTSGNSVYQNESFGGDNANAFTGKLRDPMFLFYDVSAGYWLFHDQAGSSSLVTGLAGIFEVHYNQSLSGFDSVALSTNTGFTTVPGAVQIGGGGAFTSVNLTPGFVAEIRENALLYVGVTVPTVGASGHEFDYQVLVNFNYLFGRSSKYARSNAANVPSTQ